MNRERSDWFIHFSPLLSGKTKKTQIKLPKINDVNGTLCSSVLTNAPLSWQDPLPGVTQITHFDNLITTISEMSFRQRKQALTAHIWLGHNVVAGHSKVLVEKMGPSVVISWGRKRDGDGQRHILWYIHRHTGEIKVTLPFGDLTDIKQPWKDWPCREYRAVRCGLSFGLE